MPTLSLMDQQDAAQWQALSARQRLSKPTDPGGVRTLVGQLAPLYGVDPQLAQAVAQVESNFDPTALSRAGAQGVMQLMPDTARRYGVGNVWDAEANIRAGLQYLHDLQELFPGRRDLQLAAYNAGEGAVKQYGNAIPPYPETQAYVKKVQAVLGQGSGRQPFTSAGSQEPDRLSATSAADAQQALAPWPQAPQGAQGASPTPSPEQVSAAFEPISSPPNFTTSPTPSPEQVSAAPGWPTTRKPIEPGISASMLQAALQAPAPPEVSIAAARPGEASGPSWIDQMPPRDVSWSLERAGEQFRSGVQRGTGQVLNTMANIPLLAAKMAGPLSAATGIPVGDALFLPLEHALRDVSTRLRTDPSLATPETFGDALLQAVGAAIPNLVVALVASKLGGPVVGFGVLGALEHGDEDALAMARGAAKNMLLGAFMHATHDLPPALRIPITGATFAVATAAETGGDVRKTTIEGIIGGVLAALPAAKKRSIEGQPGPLRDAITADPSLTLDKALAAAQHPETPPPDVPLPTWQRWAQVGLNLLPDLGYGPSALPGGILRNERGAVRRPSGPTLRAGAEGLPPERYRTEAGTWRIPLRDMPSQELELQDFLRQQGGINLAAETDVPGELRALISPRETGTAGLQNNLTGLSLQEMAERAKKHGFVASADKESLLHVLERSVTQGHNVYSVKAQGRVPLVENPTVAAAYQHTLEAIQTLEGRTEEQTRGTRPHAQALAEAQALLDDGLYTLDDVRQMLPGTALADSELGAVVLSLHGLAGRLQEAAQAVVRTGGRVGSREVQDLQSVMAMFAEVDPSREGARAETGRSISFMNEPMSGYNRYLDELHQALLRSPERTMLQIARTILATATPAEQEAASRPVAGQAAADVLAQHRALQAQHEAFLERHPLNPLEPGVQQPLFPRTAEFTPRTPEESAQAAQALEDWQQRASAALGEPGQRQLDLPMHEQWMDAQTWQRLRDEAQAMAKGASGAALLQSDPLFPGRGPWRTAAEWDDAIARFTAHVRELEAQGPGPEPVQQRLLHDVPVQYSPELLRTMQAQMATTRPGLADMWVEQYRAAKLGPKSWLKKTVGDAVQTAWQLPVTFLAEQLGRFHAGGVAPGAALAQLWGMAHGVTEMWAGLHQSWTEGTSRAETLATGGPLLNERGQPLRSGIADQGRPAVTAENLHLEAAGLAGKVVNLWGEYIGFASGGRQSYRILQAVTEAFKAWNFSIGRNEFAFQEAQRLGLEGRAFGDHLAEVMGNPDTAARVDAQAFERSLYLTLGQELPQGGFGAGFQAASNLRFRLPIPDPFSGEQMEIPIGKVLLLFNKMPINGAKMTVDNSPLALLSSRFYQQVAAGGTSADYALSRLMLGSITVGGLASAVLQGQITGRAPSDPVLRQEWLKKYQEYSVRLPFTDLWLDYSWLGPLAAPVAMLADTVQIMGPLEPNSSEAARLIAAITFPVMHNLFSHTAVRNLAALFSAISPTPHMREATEAAPLLSEGVKVVLDPVLTTLGPVAAAAYLAVQSVQGNLSLTTLGKAGGLAAAGSWLDAAIARATSPEEKALQMSAQVFQNIRLLLDHAYSQMAGWAAEVPQERAIDGEPMLHGYGVGPETLRTFARAVLPWHLQRESLGPANQAILDNQMQLTRVTATLAPHAPDMGNEAASADNERTMQPLTLTPEERERLQVLAALNQPRAQQLGLQIPDALVRQVTSDVAASLAPGEEHLKEAMNIGELLDWLTTTRTFQAAEGGPGRMKEFLFKRAIQEYRKIGTQLFLELDQPVGARHRQATIQHRIQLVPPQEREGERLNAERSYTAGRSTTRAMLYLPDLEIGAGSP